MDASSSAKNYVNVNVPLSTEGRRALRSRHDGSLTSIVERQVREELSKGHPIVQRAPRKTPRVCLSLDADPVERLKHLSKEMDANLTDVVFSLMRGSAQAQRPAQPVYNPGMHAAL